MIITVTLPLVIALVVIAIGAGGLTKLLPSDFVPYEDQGYLFAQINLPDSFIARTDVVHKRLAYLRSGQAFRRV